MKKYDPKKELFDLIKKLLDGGISVREFCRSYETIYNLDLEKKLLGPDERAALSAIFEVVVWYSPIPEERVAIPNYLDEEAVLRVAKDAAQRIALY